MTGFAAGMAVGCLVGIAMAVTFLLFAAVWLSEAHERSVGPTARGIATAVAVVAALSGLCYALQLPKAAAMMLLLIVVFWVADQWEVLTALVTSALSAISLTVLFLPPLRSFRIATTADWVSLDVFLVVSVVGCRMIGGR